MIKALLVLLFTLNFSAAAYADTLKSEREAKQLAERIMMAAGKGDLSSAFAVMKPYVVISDTEYQSAALQSKTQREQFGTRYGKSTGYEFISEKKAGESILRLIYIEKTERHALPWVFIFYKRTDGWVLNTFAWNDQINNAFHE